MLNNISWQGYWTTLALLTAAYYAVLYFVYFHRQGPMLFSKRSSVSGGSIASPGLATFPKTQKEVPPPPEKETAEDFEAPAGEEGILYACMDELSAYFEEAKKARTVPEELTYGVQRILSKYPTLKNTPYQDSLSNVIVSEAEHHCSVHLSEADLVQVWQG